MHEDDEPVQNFRGKHPLGVDEPADVRTSELESLRCVRRTLGLLHVQTSVHGDVEQTEAETRQPQRLLLASLQRGHAAESALPHTPRH